MTSIYPLPAVIILGAHTVGLGVLRAFKHMNIDKIVVSYDPNDMGRYSRYITHLYDAPHPETQQDDFIAFLIKLADTYSGAMVIPASDASLAAVSHWKAELSRYYTMACTEWYIAEKFIDKKKTYTLAEEAGVPAPRTIIPHNDAQAESYARSVLYPCLVKPCQSHLYFDVFHRKMVYAQDKYELLQAYRQAAAAGLEVVLQEFIPGDDTSGVNYNSYTWDGQQLVEFTASKIRNAPPNLGSPCAAVSSMVDGVLEGGRRILQAMGFYGYACTEFKYDARDGIYKLMEVNGRHNLSTLLAVSCGLNFPVLHYNHLMFGQLPQQMEYRQGSYWIDLTRDVAYHLPRVFKREYPLRQFIEPYRKRHVFAIWDKRDMKPFIKRASALLADALTGKRSVQ